MIENPKVYEAFEEEAKDIDVASLMQEMLNQFQEEKGYQAQPLDELRVRNLLLARKYKEKEVDRLTMLKQAIMEDWDKKIKKQQEEIKDINGLIEHWLVNANQGKKLSLDVGTVTLRRTAPKAKVASEEEARAYLAESGQLESFLKPAPLDQTLLSQHFTNQFKGYVEDHYNQRLQEELANNSGKKITKKREAELKQEAEKFVEEQYFQTLPSFMEYVPEKQSLSVTMK